MAVQENGPIISLIYEAALDGTRWPEAVRAVAGATGASQCVLHFFDGTGLTGGLAPMMAPEAVRSYKEHWREYTPHWRHAQLYPVGRIFHFDDETERAALRRTAIYHEWWKPQGLGLAMRGANLVADEDGTVMASVYKPEGEEFSGREKARFDSLTDHLVRGVEIHRRLRLAQLPAAQGTEAAQPGFVVVDRRGRLLSDDGPTCAALAETGFVVSDGTRRRLRTYDRRLERLIAGGEGGSCDVVGQDGEQLRFCVAPVRAETEAAPQWLRIDRPAALVHVSVPAEQRRTRIQRLVAAHRLTRAEAEVAVEIARGDGRAAVAGRLGIRETTVRSHLTAIFDKLNVHRQSELVNMVAGPL